MPIDNSIHALAANIKLVVFDVDGVMTDGRLYFTSLGDEIKAFNVKDGLGIKWLHDNEIQTAVITGRSSELVKKRVTDLGIHHLQQGREDKVVALKELLSTLDITSNEVAYMGDDLPDLAAIRYVGLGATVADALPIVVCLLYTSDAADE
ncbi:MAG: HAD hydrolase family protein, partial [Pseudomonadales bacterium]|nr:HAD hydrolase family protein [Pseudomonadales bacterium]